MTAWLVKALAHVLAQEVEFLERIGEKIVLPDFDLISSRRWETKVGEYSYLGEAGGCWIEADVIYQLRVFIHCDRKRAAELAREEKGHDKKSGRGAFSAN